MEKKKMPPDRSDSNIQDGKLDIGNIFQIRSLDGNLKLQILQKHWKPGKSYPFPVRDSRKFTIIWLDRKAWLSYFKELDGAFCVPCVLFEHQCGHNGMKLNKLYKEPLTNWQSVVTKFEEHDKNPNFHKALAKSINSKSIMTRKSEGIGEQCNQMLNERIQNNRRILHSIVKLWYSVEDKTFLSMATVTIQNTMTVLIAGTALLKFRVSSGDDTLKHHFDSTATNAMYRSKTTQNKLVTICGDQVTETI